MYKKFNNTKIKAYLHIDDHAIQGNIRAQIVLFAKNAYDILLIKIMGRENEQTVNSQDFLFKFVRTVL